MIKSWEDPDRHFIELVAGKMIMLVVVNKL